MIKVNLLPVKKKKKAKPIPSFLISMIVITLVAALACGYVFYHFSSRLSERKAQHAANEQKIAQLKVKVKEVEDFERRNKLFQQRKEVIEELGKNRTLPVKVIDEISTVLPSGVWLTSLDVSGTSVKMNGTAFTNTDVVNFINNLKASKRFDDVYLQQSVQAKIGTREVYNFGVTCKVNL